MRTFLLLFLVCAPCYGGAIAPDALAKIGFEQKLGAQTPLDLSFRDETGRAVQLGDYFGSKPVILVLGYYNCPMLCTLVNDGLIETLQDLRPDIGSEFNIVSVSIDPNEKPALAAAKKREYLRRYGRAGGEDGWHFLTGDEEPIRRLASAAGFGYAYDSGVKQFAHPTGFLVLTPHGIISRYFFGVTFSPGELRAALADASAEKAGSRIQQLFLLCFHYSPITGKYGALIMNVVRGCAAATLLALGAFVFVMVRRDRAAGRAAA
jgi:protein SCO1/2